MLNKIADSQGKVTEIKMLADVFLREEVNARRRKLAGPTPTL